MRIVLPPSLERHYALSDMWHFYFYCCWLVFQNIQGEHVLKQSIIHVRNLKVSVQLKKKNKWKVILNCLNARKEKLNILATKNKQIT